MARRNRETLKKSFRKGKKPTENDFENLIDSTLNILEDGFFKSPENGIELTPLIGEKRVVMSVYREAGDPDPAWEISVGTRGELKICRYGNPHSKPFVVLSPDGDIQIGDREKKIIFPGLSESPGRIGTFLSGEVPADGKWHAITPGLEGVRALEVVAAAGRRTTGKHAILVAWATHCFGSKPQIKKIQSHYGVFGNKLVLRWVVNELKATLHIRSFFDYRKDIKIHYRISTLWDNPFMENI
ncbi:MAG: hypothetical protein LUH10_04060 [Tannerellaceae bacterium]|nr:hypothetical protein [Tannerellaceae bacterium]